MRTGRILVSLALFACVAGVAYVAQLAQPAGGKMSRAAEAFLDSLKDDQRAKASFKFDDPERINWHFIPMQNAKRETTRKGLGIYEMSKEQHKAALDLLRAGTSMSGYDKAVTIMSLEAILRDLEKNGRSVRNPQWYFFSVFGKPGSKGKWGWRVEGHHLSLNFTVEDGKVAAHTPAFFGANPAKIMQGPKKGERALPQSEDLAKALLKALDADQKKVAYSKKLHVEVEQAKKAPSLGEPIGLAGAKMTDKQKDMLWDLLEAYANRMSKDVAQLELAEVKRGGLDKVYFSYAGGVENGKPYTYRVHGPSFAIEFLNTQPDAAGNPANHIHSVWRHLGGDFGLTK